MLRDCVSVYYVAASFLFASCYLPTFLLGANLEHCSEKTKKRSDKCSELTILNIVYE